MKGEPSYFSNQCPRTYAPKPAYATRFRQARRLRPPFVDVLKVIRSRARRYLADLPSAVGGVVRHADSREPGAFRGGQRFDWIITSPPYYGNADVYPRPVAAVLVPGRAG
jgi:hypothetical protein